ncbi:DUF7537 family lipoprotein [Halocatena pleomorpha]|uniref:Uncharacterized protein n=1 Tax=Halocatena pleomorpha TaxID=1785090 RepID=A0A3P3R595_9EURY|nr:hypothetical protein [Halocatena pleomorpha]RRJ28059.1 hypothetical protein EIK79_16885 [Halocatena pleomorpha]
MEMKSFQCAVLLILVVGLAGCSGLSPSESTSYPTGYNESGIVDPELAADQHATALSEHDNYTERMRITSPTLDGFVTTTIRTDTVENRSAAALEINNSGETFMDSKMYHDGTKRYTNTQIDVYGDTYATGNESLSSFQDSLVNTSQIDNWLANISFEAAGTVTRDGATLYRYNSTGVDDPEAFFYTTEFVTIDAIESVDSTLLVDEKGLIRVFEVTVTHSSDGETEEGTISYRVTDIDATAVEKPDWLGAAKAYAEPNGSEPVVKKQ